VMDPYLLRVLLIVSYPSELEPARISERVQLDGLAGHILEAVKIAAPSAMTGFGPSDVAVAQYRPPESVIDHMMEADPSFDAARFESDWRFVNSLSRDRGSRSCRANGASRWTGVTWSKRLTPQAADNRPLTRCTQDCIKTI
jgi:hypothetical protein